MVTKLFIGNDRLDLYNDENISLVSSIQDSQDITKNTTDFTKSFVVPASDINNAIFKHWYDASIDNSFDARIKAAGRIELDGVPFRSGKWRLSKVSVKKGKADSYTINFFGNLVDIPKALGNFELSDLNLSAFTHDRTGANIKQGLEDGLSDGSIIYNLLAKKQLYYSSDPTDTTQEEKTANIAYNSGNNTGVYYSDLKPSIRLIEIIKAIESDRNLTFSRDFFGRTEFLNLYLWCNNDKDRNVKDTAQLIRFDGGDNTYIPTTPPNNTTGTFPALNWAFVLNITPLVGYENTDYSIAWIIDGEEVKVSKKNNGNRYTLGYFADKTVQLKIEIRSQFKIQYYGDLEQREFDPLNDYPLLAETSFSTNTLTPVVDIAANLPKLKLTEFLKGLFKAFKLVVIPLENGTIYVNTLQAYYAEGVLYDYTKYIDFENYDVSRGDMLNDIKFNFEEPTTVLNAQFLENNRIAYGDEEAELTDSEGNALDGDSLEFKVPFEQIIYDRLIDTYTNDITTIQYGAIINETLDTVNPKAHIFYNIKQDINANHIAFTDEFNNTTALSAMINTCSHTETFENQQFAMLFSEEFSTWNGQRIENNLYSNYHQNYINDLFNIKRRNWDFTAYLPLDKLSLLELNDILKIKEDYYRIDRYELNLLNGEAKLKLINAFDTQIGGFIPSQTSIFVDYNSQISSIYITFLNNYSYNKEDLGFGVDWVTISNIDSNMYFDFDENTNPTPREMNVEVTNTDTGQTITIYLNQTGNNII